MREFTVIKMDKQGKIIEEAGPFNGGAVCFYLDTMIDIKKHDFKVVKDRTSEFTYNSIGFNGGWKHKSN